MRISDKNRVTHSTTECNGKLGAVGDALYVIGGKWKLRVIIALSEGNRRFNDLQRTVSGISARVLSNELKELELNGFVKRNVYTEPAVIIEYELTEYSDTLDPVLQSLINWGEMHRAKIKSDAKTAILLTDQAEIA
ncbi:winged helix-turn-helix transcriptional regulator [Dyadobacter arcticus]|uniref:DNA-binding HxlR family transcriptional regulator n=1 Tax=Dyadobacter arcticus TaxID=1078754 RepID=A0ABX0UTU7_9BACT|nr:helix-turn-helix domain-containing protein [Dyadobacter arcticus]NIJ55060.1 DNA-binding HxlR family transcriptional regulator [Dyadobacter arcticus]